MPHNSFEATLAAMQALKSDPRDVDIAMIARAIAEASEMLGKVAEQNEMSLVGHLLELARREALVLAEPGPGDDEDALAMSMFPTYFETRDREREVA